MPFMLALILFAFTLSCADSLKDEVTLETLSMGSEDAAPMLSIPAEEKDKEHPVFAGTYSITITAKKSGKVICSGDFDGVLWSNQLFMPRGEMSCPLGKTMDLEETFPADIAKNREDLPHFGYTVRRVPRTGYTMQPQPVVGLALVQGHKDFEGFSLSEEISVGYTEDDTEKKVTGKFAFAVASINGEMEVESEEVFKNVISYRVNTEGFDALPSKKDAGIETQRQTWVNTRPIALLKIEIQSTLKEQLPGLIGSIGDAWYGPIVITIQLKKSRPTTEDDYQRLPAENKQ